MRRWLCFALLLAASCSEEPSTPVNTASAVAPKPAATLTSPAPDAASTDTFATDYAVIRQQITRWDGDEAKLTDARQRLMAIIARDRTYAPAYAGLARVEAALGPQKEDKHEGAALERATKFAQHAVKLDESSFEAHITAGWIARFRGDFDLAEASLRRAEELKPGSTEVKLVRASIALEQEDPQRMMKLTREVIAQSTDEDERAEAYNYLIAVYEAGSHLEEADAAHKELISMRPNSAWAHGNYAALLLIRDDVDGAIREAERAAEIRKYPIGTAVLAQSYLVKAQQLWESNKITESANLIAKVGELASGNADLSFALGKFYEGAAIRGKDASMKKKALASYRKALELNPQHMEAERAVARMSKHGA